MSQVLRWGARRPAAPLAAAGAPSVRTSGAAAPQDDGALLERARAGDELAGATLYQRHVAAALTLARRLAAEGSTGTDAGARARREEDAEHMVARAFADVLRPAGDGATDGAVRPGLLLAVARCAGRERRDDVVRAFLRVPPGQQVVLWHAGVEGETPEEVAVLLGVRARAVARLQAGAEQALAAAWLDVRRRRLPAGHEPVADQLPGLVEERLGPRTRSLVADHVQCCPACRELHEDYLDVRRRGPELLGSALLGTGPRVSSAGAR